MANNYQRPEVLAQLFGVTTRRIQQLTQDGVLVSEKIQGESGRKYDLVPNIKSYIAYLQEKLKAKKGNSEAVQENLNAKLAAEVRIKTARAEIAEMELRELKGQMFRSGDIEKLTNELVYSVRALLLSLPSRICIDVASMDDPSEVNEYVKKVVYSYLTDLSKHEFSVDSYLQIIKDREGIMNETSDDEDLGVIDDDNDNDNED